MTRLVWDEESQRKVNSGIDRGVLYSQEGIGVPWNGLVSVETNDSPHETRSYFLDGQKVFQDPDTGDFEASVTAYIYPNELETQRDVFGMSYRTIINGENRTDYLLHILYNVGFVHKDKNYQTISLAIDPTMFEFDMFSLPSRVDGFKNGTHFTIDSRTAYPWLLAELESILYGDEVNDPRLPNLPELMHIFEENSILKITDHGDGTWSAEGPPVYFLNETEFAIDWPSVIYLNSETYRVRSL